MPVIESRHFIDSKSFSSRHHGRIGCAEWEVTVFRHKFCNPQPVAREYRFRNQIALCEVGKESDLGLNPQTGPQQVRDFRDHKGWHKQRPGMSLKKFEARLVMLIVSIDVSEERSGVDDQRDEPNSVARISSIRSEMSVRPLAPAPAARSRRRPVRPPRCASMASRVISEIVIPRRCASWRSRASRSSGSLTVVRFMYASIPSRTTSGVRDACDPLRGGSHLVEREQVERLDAKRVGVDTDGLDEFHRVVMRGGEQLRDALAVLGEKTH